VQSVPGDESGPTRYAASMTPDFRSDPMETPEGQGVAKKAWEAYVKIGFWVMWHLYGGFEGLVEFGMNKSTIWRKVARFRKMTGEHPDVFVMPGIEIDQKTYWSSSTKKVGRPPKK
jgi:hypothetical protein